MGGTKHLPFFLVLLLLQVLLCLECQPVVCDSKVKRLERMSV